jgi:ribose transport system substrate-binding protein
MKERQDMIRKKQTLAGLVSLSLAAAATMVPASAMAQDPAVDCAVPDGWAPVWYASAPHPYFDEVVKGVDAFAEEFGVEVDKQVGPDWTQDSQNQRMEALTAKGARSFSVYPTNASGANALYEELTGQGAKIVSFGASTQLPTTATLVVATDVKSAAAQAAEALIEAMGGSGKIINVLEILTDPNTVLRKEGIEEVVANHPDVEIIQEVAGIQSAEEAVQKISDAVAANAETADGIIATGFLPSVAIAQVLADYREQGGERDIKAVGIDTDPVVMDAIANGIMTGTIAQNPIGHGYISMIALACIENGYGAAEGAYHIDAGTAFVTAENIDTFADDVAAITQSIRDSLLTQYMTK